MGVGHVAIVVGNNAVNGKSASATEVYIGEENWSNDYWNKTSRFGNYSRVLKYECQSEGNCTLVDPDEYTINGWQRVIKSGYMSLSSSIAFASVLYTLF